MDEKILENKNQEFEIVSEKKVSCDGGGEALGHPKVFLDMGKNNKIICPYCSKLFSLI